MVFWGYKCGLWMIFGGYFGDVYALMDRGNSVMMYQSNQGNIKSI